MFCYNFPRYEYTVCVPDPHGDYSRNEGDDCDFNFDFDEKKKPAIILFGWAASSDRYLRIYSRIYEAKGFTTIRFIVPMPSMFIWKRHILPISKKMVEVVENLNLGGRPILVHCMSNGGSYLYQYFKEAMKSSKTPILIRGVIFDSAPGRITYTTAYRATEGAYRSSLLNKLKSIMILMLVSIIWIAEFIDTDILKMKVIRFQPINYLLEEDSKYPQHFIYSKIDKVTPYKDVEFFMAKRKAMGIEVSSLCYEDTEHVKHYPHKKYTYTKSIFNFISKCLELDSSMV